MRVNLRGSERGMAQQLLDVPQIHSAIQQVCDEAVPNCVRVETSQARAPGYEIDYPSDLPIRESPRGSPSRWEKGSGLAAAQMFSQCPGCHATERHNLLLPSLSAQEYFMIPKIQVFHSNRHQFPDPATRGVEQFQQSTVAVVFGRFNQ